MRFYLPVLLFLTLLISRCSASVNDSDEILAEVGNNTLTKKFAKSQIPTHIFQQDSLQAYQNYRDDWIRRQIILEEASRLNFMDQPGVQEKIQRLREEFILQSVQDYIINEFEGDIEVSEQEARSYYQQNKDKFTLEEQYVQYRHVITESNVAAESAKEELMRGIEWEVVARRYSKYPELKIRESEKYWPISIAGGDIATLNRYLRIIGPSEISPTFRSGNEFHFVQLTDERPEGDHPELTWLIDQIREWLILEKRKRAFNTYVKNLYLQAQANNEIKLYNLDNEGNTSETDTVSLNQITNEE
ncbi:MAG: peptidylprolyl isomerase [Gracilimonas sp.]|nr:peptidylprolyl isomerase [Gracilimonas sp.]